MAGETIPPLFAAVDALHHRRRADGGHRAAARRVAAHLAARARLVHPDRGAAAGRERRPLLRRAQRPDRARVADHRLGAALGRRAAAGGTRAAALAGARRCRRRLRRCRRARAPVRRRDGLGHRPLRPLGADVVGRLGALGATDDARRPVRGDGVRDARRRSADAADLRLHGAPLLAVERVDPRLDLPGHVRLDRRLHGLRLADRERAARARLDLRVREPGRRDHARRARSAAST